MVFEIKLNGANFFFFGKHFSYPDESRKPSASPCTPKVLAPETSTNTKIADPDTAMPGSIVS